MSLHCLQKLQKAEDELEWETGVFVVGQHLEEPQHASHLQPEPFVAKRAELLLLKEVLKCVVMWDPSSLKLPPRCFFLLLGWVWSVAWWAFPPLTVSQEEWQIRGRADPPPRGSAGSQGWPIQCPKGHSLLMEHDKLFMRHCAALLLCTCVSVGSVHQCRHRFARSSWEHELPS